ncbi:hypothetical protein ACR8R1_000467 [Enterobacter hormaechei]|uniref:hypothetical protein n=1 Tax=Enterobacter hormaechei TaxID=158836 RepID=UPI00079256B5|nr:hypothetical protein [Enterobacter hormaechei]SAE19436.1 Uncharacterised protein [Enterobacter cloacae]GJL06378.1 hypothetical protein TUM17571_06860 [Klebsiella pneumoniae]QPO62726.1 hypothetical protein GVI72_12680 [Enterobacter hormaechei]GFQ10658.1 hypothetical protein MH17539M_17620 [Enterobacter hormaechei]GFQ14678.1 hypothetical protein NIHE141904_09880 [Enterobacter hormaechei]
MTSNERAEESVPECQPNEGEEKLYVVFCIPSAETIHQGFGAHYTLIYSKKENGNSVSKTICADSHKFVIKALRPNVIL